MEAEKMPKSPNHPQPAFQAPSDTGFSDKIAKFRDSTRLGEFAKFKYAVCSFETERAEFGHDSMMEAIKFAKSKWGNSYDAHCTIVKNSTKMRNPG
jgi:hypothetical protein